MLITSVESTYFSSLLDIPSSIQYSFYSLITEQTSRYQLPTQHLRPLLKAAMSDTIEQFGFTAVPRSLDKLIATQSTRKTSRPVTVDEVEFPDTPLARSIHAYAKENLPRQTYNHSMRVFYYGKILENHPARTKEETNMRIRRPRHRSAAFPLLEVQLRNPPPRRFTARHRHHTREPHLHAPLLRIRWRLPRARPSQVPPRRSRAS